MVSSLQIMKIKESPI